MTTYTEKLIDIYATCNTDKISKNPRFIKLRNQHKHDQDFPNINREIQDIKKLIEKRVLIQSYHKNQIIKALKVSNRIVKTNKEESIKIVHDLIIKMFRSKWTRKQLNHFETFFTALENCYDYCLSFTKRNPSPGQVNIINQKYKFLIKDILGHKKYKQANRIKDNLLAASINYLLENEQLNGFYYPHKEGDSQKVKQKLKEGCENSFVFVQLIQNVMFTDLNDENFCFFEYNVAVKPRPFRKHFKFLLAGNSHKDLIKEEEVSLEYDDWYQNVYESDKLIIEPTDVYNAAQIKELKDKISEKLLQSVKNSKWELIDKAI